ncbi:tetratricopeptide repeat protein [Flavobacterium sp. Fl-77]|uniref:Tetratricopeptide repeat protein n=1 Tax=Flavobacterium flavipigmentatum TaxID=2893884 RepID=A0AAJ2VXC2_9FLAO|nr:MULTISPECIES: tetratricopeptide repeat protein [unclassified Flavobacterium]MDX6181897.1 tetratricopeptide repeat protein [Flavobacterium sp. Fl-33]MDX6185069.1 tetratricopeptide repeat protein [Flavobacterium sp. Fl-77]UFH37179.1 tetratricopeptide repeat protein [Flavobacterium sp. F-70]
MRKLSWFFLIQILLISTTVLAQKSAIYTYDLKDFDKALALYNDKQYTSAQLIFEGIKNKATTEEVQSDCAYYIANCAIRTNQSNADALMEKFVNDYPTSTKQNQAYKEVAQFFFEQGNYPKALLWFDKVDESYMSKSDLDKYNFQKGYAYFNAKNKKEATTYFNKVVNSAEYGSQAKYYLGFMAYEGDDYKEATKYFDEVSGEEKYKEKLSYYQADMNFKLGNFQKAIDLGQKAMAKSNELEKSELNKIIGESYFNLKQYDKAIPFLEQYAGKKGKWNNTDFYQLGYAYYEQKNDEKAISQFNKIIEGKDFVAQNAYYHLGLSYLNTGKKQEALNAFKNASEMEFNVQIQEDAALNYAKLSYEIGNAYQNVPAVLLDFLKKYPNNSSRSEVEKLLVDSYISSKNYKEALVLLEKNKTPQNKLAYQKVLFYRGVELYNEQNYTEASKMFRNAVSEQKSPEFTARATFWKAETEYLAEDFQNALLSYKKFAGLASAKTTDEYKNINYNIGYTYFKVKEYDSAATSFQAQIDVNKDDKVRLNDSYLRLGDCRFVSAKYGPAMEAYSKAIDAKGVDADYAQFQKAMSYGFMSKNDKKIEELNNFLQKYKKSEYRDDALYELANTYSTEKKNDQAIKTYDHLIAEYKNGLFTSKSILKQGLIYYNSDKDEQALTKFKKVAADFPKTPEALEAVSTARLIYVDSGKVDEYATWVRTLDFVAVTDAELDNDTYEGAFKQYSQNNSKLAITGFSGYVSKFPKGIHALEANFYLAQLLYTEGSESKTVANYQYVIDQPRNEFTEQALTRLSQIFLKDKDCDKAVPILTRLENESDFPQNKTFAQANLMKCYYDKKDYGNSVEYAEKVLQNPKGDVNVKSDAQIIVARAAMQTGEEEKAKAAYAKLSSTSKGELAAEALYYDAYFKTKEGKFDASNVAVQKLAKNYSGYKYYGAKSLVLMAKNFYGLKDSYQATYILDNVINNFTDYPDVVEEAKRELNAIKAEEAKTNSSITK